MQTRYYEKLESLLLEDRSGHITCCDTIYFMSALGIYEIIEEDNLVADLSVFGITYLSNRISPLSNPRHTPKQILAACVQQPSSRVRTAVIALFLLHPEFSRLLPSSLSLLLNEEQRQLLRIFYTSAVQLQRLYQDQLLLFMPGGWEWLPDFFGSGFGILPDTPPRDALLQLGKKHQELTRSVTNWAGTYESAALHLIRYKQREQQWNQLLPKSSLPS